MKRSRTLWILALVLTLISAAWQRYSGPTHKLHVHESLDGVAVAGTFLRSHSTSSDLPIHLEVSGVAVEGRVVWRRLNSSDAWLTISMQHDQNGLMASLPAQPAAGKVEYRVALDVGGDTHLLPDKEAVVARFKDDVPTTVLIPHIIVMFLAMLWSTRTGLAALANSRYLNRYAWVTLLLLVVGGLILGPVVQKAAFGAYWTGWPFGEDLTDNKVAVAVLAWLLAALRSRSRGRRTAVLIASLVTLIIFAIPHSMHGSTLDYESMQKISG